MPHVWLEQQVSKMSHYCIGWAACCPVCRGPPVREGAARCVMVEWRSTGLVFELSLELEMFGGSSLFVVFVY